MKRILQCNTCGAFTLQSTHCSVPTQNIIPPRYRPDFLYKKHRRDARKDAATSGKAFK